MTTKHDDILDERTHRLLRLATRDDPGGGRARVRSHHRGEPADVTRASAESSETEGFELVRPECRRRNMSNLPIVLRTPPAPKISSLFRVGIFFIFVLTRRAFSRTRTATPSTSRA